MTSLHSTTFNNPLDSIKNKRLGHIEAPAAFAFKLPAGKLWQPNERKSRTLNQIVFLKGDAMTDSQPVEVYSAVDVPEAHLVQAMLLDAGIEARIVGDHLQGAVGDLPAVSIAPRIWVHAQNVEKARQIILAWQQEKRDSRAGDASKWKCSGCGETNEPAFELCWNCQTEVPAG